MSVVTRLSGLFVSALVLTGAGVSMNRLPWLLSSPAIAALPPVEINKKAKDVTVMIQSVENPDLFGSGVIIRRSGNTYTVLTAYHVISGSPQYTVMTSDEVQYAVKDIQPIPDADMATVTFDSSATYPVATLGDAANLQEGESVFISGFPKASEGFGIVQRQFVSGNITSIIRSNRAIQQGYSIAYNNLTRAGMSGGPVFNDEGQLIAIHGRTSTPDKTWVNMGMPINLFKSAGGRSPSRPPAPTIPVPQPIAQVPSPPPPVQPTPQREPLRPSPTALVAESQSIPDPLPTTQPTPVVVAEPPKSKPTVSPTPQPRRTPVVQAAPSPAPTPRATPVVQAILTPTPMPIASPQIALLNPTPKPSLQPNQPPVDPLRGIQPYTVAAVNSPVLPSAAPPQCREVEVRVNTIVTRKTVCDGLGESTAANKPQEYPENYVRDGNSQIASGNLSQAIKAFSKALDLKDNYPEAYFNRGYAYYKSGNIKKAIEDFNQALRLFQNQHRDQELEKVRSILDQIRSAVS